MYISGEVYAAVRGRPSEIMAGLQAVRKWASDTGFADMDLPEEAVWGAEELLNYAERGAERPADLDGLEGEELEDALSDYEGEPWNRPGDEVMVYRMDDALSYDGFIMDGLAALVEGAPALEAAVLVMLNYSVCGNALYSFYSAPGESAFRPDHRKDDDWCPTGEEGNVWEVSFMQEAAPGGIRLRFPPDADWVPFWDWLTHYDDRDCGDEDDWEDEEDDEDGWEDEDGEEE